MILISAVEGSPISPPRPVTHARLPIGTSDECPSKYLRYLRFPTDRNTSSSATIPVGGEAPDRKATPSS